MVEDRVQWREVVNSVLNLCWPNVQPSTSQEELCCIESYLYLFTRFAKLFFSFSKIWTCFCKLFWKLLLIIRIGYILLFTAGNIVNTWAIKCYLRYGWPSRSTCATESCVFVVCCWCRCGNYSTNWIFVNVAQIVTVYCIELSFHFFCFMPHTTKFAVETATCGIISNGESNKTEGPKKKKDLV